MTRNAVPSDGRNSWLEMLRGFAALWVLLHHANQSVSAFVAPLGHSVWFENGYLGVDFFFVLSGFIIAMSSQSLVERGKGWREYLQARLIRIYVPYLPIGVAMYLLYLLLPGLSEGGRSPGWWTSLTLLPSNSPPALSVAWTLVHEMLFYLIFLAWFWRRRVFWVCIAVWASLIIGRSVAGVEMGRAWGYVFSPLNLYFLLGVGLFHATRSNRIGNAWVLALLTIAFGVLLVVCGQPNPDRVWVGVAFALMLVAFTAPGIAARKAPAALVLLGGASYSIYLVHNPALSLAVRLMRRLPGLGAWPSFFAIAAMSLAAGVCYWWFFERAALRVVRQKITAA
ncbi:acyltransferase family protein [Hydrogenophaga sp. RWCD_12]|uniref:acyltransferase family protein n=1 Tax=Hydrogenophaga sp. RWCD_12 TaxID=3391190 RepID=UPI003984B0DA